MGKTIRIDKDIEIGGDRTGGSMPWALIAEL